MRWQNLMLDESQQQSLPGYRDPAVVRRFEAPEALDMRFYEIHAKSVLNRVPGRSPMPFRWTVNPYRGCSHACSYCLAPHTPILMADGRTKPIADLSIGDEIVGTVRRGTYRHFTTTEVLDKWSSIKPAWQVTLEDGTELVASEDHRFLTGRGWKHVTGTQQGLRQRPHLTTNSKLLGTGSFAVPPEHDEQYKRGYLCGMIRGDGHVGAYEYDRPGRAHGNAHRFRRPLSDSEALERFQLFLLDLGVQTASFRFAEATATTRRSDAIRTSAESSVDEIRQLIEWPALPSLQWIKGFLAGIFDAEGSFSQTVLRISNGDPEIVDWLLACLRHLRFDAVLEPVGEQGTSNVRITGGLPEHMRFLLMIDPAISRKRSIDGRAVKTGARLRVVSVRPLGEVMRMYDITTGTGDFIADGVVSHNCFARPTHTYLGFNAGRDFEREIVVKVNAPEVLRRELSRPSWTGEHVALGTNTDPYQWVEGRYRLMPGIWEAMRDSDTVCSVLTKSPLLLRDIDILRELAQAGLLTAALSVPTLEERAWRATEPHTPHPRARLEAVAELNRNGIPTSVLVAPLMPGINDDPRHVRRIVELAHEAGAVNITPIALHLRPGVREVFMEWLEANRPDLVERYEGLYSRGANAPAAERERLVALVRESAPRRRRGARFERRRSERTSGAAAPARRPAREPPQATLF